ncbi:MAG: recombinase XerC, partial [Alphaproteobacteria bacterium]|nr:recombinase XerC [Alphaproteobacteria bacterium]
MRDSSLRAPRLKSLPDASYFSAAPAIAEEAALWLRYLAGERRASRT